ncbi:MAG: hypothetical protein LBT00_08815 [Spirochaetaceae bacterium]|nr:hypothetical protein [Spirochaetaceae bacterium]
MAVAETVETAETAEITVPGIRAGQDREKLFACPAAGKQAVVTVPAVRAAGAEQEREKEPECPAAGQPMALRHRKERLPR